jgi:hypothetical protein
LSPGAHLCQAGRASFVIGAQLFERRLADKQGSHHSAINCIRCNGAGRCEVAYIRGDLFRNLRMES